MSAEDERLSDEASLEQLLEQLGVTKRITEVPIKTYGNVSPEYSERWDVDEDSLRKAEEAGMAIDDLVRRNPGRLPGVINGLIQSAEHFESIKYVEGRSGSWIDGALSLKVVTSIVSGFGEPALRLLEGRKEKAAKSLYGHLRAEIRNEKIKSFLGKMLQ